MLDRWLASHAYIAFVAVERPWEVEAKLLSMISPPLTLSGNVSQTFKVHLSHVRAIAKAEAVVLPVVADNGGRRRISLTP